MQPVGQNVPTLNQVSLQESRLLLQAPHHGVNLRSNVALTPQSVTGTDGRGRPLAALDIDDSPRWTELMWSRHFSWLYFVYVCRPRCTINSLSLLLECNTTAACEAYASIKLSLTLCLIMSCMVRLLSEIPACTTEWLFAAQWWLTVQTKRCPLGWAQITVTPSGASGVGGNMRHVQYIIAFVLKVSQFFLTYLKLGWGHLMLCIFVVSLMCVWRV